MNFNKFYKEVQELKGEEKYSKFYDLVNNIIHKDNLDESLHTMKKYVDLFDNSNTEPGQLRTILVSLKSFKNNDILKGSLDNIKNRLKDITGKSKV